MNPTLAYECLEDIPLTFLLFSATALGQKFLWSNIDGAKNDIISNN